MKCICLGTLITLLHQCRVRKSDRYKNICKGIFAAYGLSIDNRDSTMPGHLREGHDPVPPDLCDAARDLQMDAIKDGITVHLIPLIRDDMCVALFRAIKAVLREDDSITDSTVIGKIQGYEKNSILENTNFDKAELLANVITYAIISVDNKNKEKNVKEIDKDYVDGFVDSGDEIYFIDPIVAQTYSPVLKRTIKDPAFDRIFKLAAEIVISQNNNPTRASVYYIDPQNCKFRFKELEEYIVNNIGSYIYSRTTAQRIAQLSQNPTAVGSRAMLKFIQTYGNNAENVLGELLLYVFLEQALGAPKIMSRIELDAHNNGIVSKSDGIHLLSLDGSVGRFHQLVFGASNIVGDLTTAVDRAFEKIMSIESNSDNELRMVESAAQWGIFDQEETRYMVDLMRPRKGENSKPDMAFGAFLGYTINLHKPETDSQKYKTAVKDQLIADINAIQPYIYDLIEKNGLNGYSFYFYILPFNDAPNEKTNIINSLLTGGVD